MQATQRRVLDAATAAFRRTTGLATNVVTRPRPTAGTGVLVEVQADRRRYRFAAEVKAVDRFATPALVKSQLAGLKELPILVAPYVTREVALRCRELRLAFMDTAGNAYLEAPGLLVWVTGEARPAELAQARFRALTPAGLQIAFVLLCRPELILTNYREIAGAANVALGTVGPALKDLEARRLIQFPRAGKRHLRDPKRLLDEWTAHYATTLRPKLNPRQFEAAPERLAGTDLTQLEAYWGGEVAADRLTNTLKPAAFTIYGREPDTRLVAGLRLRAHPAGNVELLDVFWNLPPEPGYPDLVPAPLAYADLLATQDGRNLEAAGILYERIIEPAFHRAG